MEALSSLIPLVAFAAAGGIALAIYSAMTGNREVLKDRLAGYTQPIVPSEVAAPGSTGVLKEHKKSGVPLLGSLPGGNEYAEKVASDLATAGLPLRLGEYLLIRWVCAMALGLVPMLVGRPALIGVPLALVGYFLPRWYVGRRMSGRISTFNDQLCDALAMMSNSMRAGSSFLQAIDMVAHELPPPIGEEFSIVVAEAAVGAPIEEALNSLTERIKSYDLFIAVTAIMVQRQTGGSLSEVLDNISQTIRDRIRLLRQVQVLTAEVRLSGYVVGLLPIALFVIFQLISPGYYAGFFDRLGGKVMMGTAGILQVVGFLAMKKVSQIDI